MPCPKNRSLGKLPNPKEGSLTWTQAYVMYPALVLGGIIGAVFLQQFAVDLYNKLFRNNGGQG